MKKLWKRLRHVDRVALLAIVFLGTLLLVYYLIVGVWIHKNEPIYPAYMKHPASISELRSDLDACEQTKQIIVPDLSDRFPDSLSFTTMMDGTTRSAKPNGYCLVWDNAENDGIRLHEIEGYLLPEHFQLYGETYREKRTKFEHPSDNYSKLWFICGDYYYTISASFDASELSEAEIEERNEVLEAFLYSIADQIIDAPIP